MAEQIVDTKGLNCPLPVLRARKVLKSVQPDDIITVLATDPASVKDFQNFCDASGHTLLEQKQMSDHFVFRIRKASA